MDVKIFNYDFLEVLAEKPVDAGTALIFIDLTGNGVAQGLDLKIEPKNLLKIDLHVLNLSESKVIPFSSTQADRIADFVKKHKEDIDTLLCIDSTGTTTYSAGVAAAIREYYSHDGIEIFIDPDYKPEVGAFHLVFEALQGDHISEGEDDISDWQGKNLEVQLPNQSSLQELAKEPFKNKTALISVCDDDCEGDLDLKNSPDYFFEINMDEVYVDDNSYDEDEDEDEDDEGFWVTPVFDYGQAERIADFVNQHKDDIDVLICQGFEYTTEDYSRAIAAAVEEFYNHDGIEIFKEYHLHIGVFQMMYSVLTDDFFDDFVYLLK